MKTISLNRNARDLQENNGMRTRGPSVKCQCLPETNLIGETDFIVTWCSPTDSGVLSNSNFHFQGNIFSIRDISERLYIVFA
jgi:hypothetical protein